MWQFRKLQGRQRGATLVEVMVAIALAGVLLPGLATALVTANAGRPATSQQLQAASLLREATEAVRVRREAGWANIPTTGTYFPAISGNTWTLTAGSQTVNGFTRQIVFSTVQRNSSGQIVASGGTVDPSTIKAVATVSWTTPYSSSISSEAYITRWQGNTTWTQTTQATFNTGTLTNTVTTSTAGGEVQLDIGTVPSWTVPAAAGTLDITGNTDATDVYVDSTTNRAYVVNGTGNTLSIINVATPTSPALLGTYAIGAAANSVYVSGNYAYLATASNTAELTVVNVSNPAAPSLADTLNLGDTVDALSVFVSGNYAYVGKVVSTTGGINEFYIADVTTPTNITLSGSLNLTAAVNSIFVSGNFAYLATAITTAELTVVNVTTKTAPTSAGTLDLVGTVAATDIFVSGTTAYITRLNNTSGGELFAVNVTTPAAPALLGSHEVGANTNGVYIVGTDAFLATESTTRRFTVVNVTNPASMTTTGNFNNANNNNDIFVYNNYAFIASTNNTGELTVLQRGTIAGGFDLSGTYESASFDAGATRSFNYLTYTATVPANSNLQFQIATNTNNSTWNYVGPDGTASTFFTAPGAIPYSAASGRYIRYKATFTGDGTVTPVMNDVTVNYSL